MRLNIPFWRNLGANPEAMSKSRRWRPAVVQYALYGVGRKYVQYTSPWPSRTLPVMVGCSLAYYIMVYGNEIFSSCQRRRQRIVRVTIIGQSDSRLHTSHKHVYCPVYTTARFENYHGHAWQNDEKKSENGTRMHRGPWSLHGPHWRLHLGTKVQSLVDKTFKKIYCNFCN